MTTLYYYKDFMDENSNLSLKSWDEMCDLAYSFKEDYFIIFVCLINWIFSLLTIILLFQIFKSKELKRVYFLSDLDLKASF